MVAVLPAPMIFIRGLGAVPLSTAQIQAQITQAANAAGVPPSIALGVAQHESGFQPTAQNPSSSAAGLFQLTSAAQQYEGVTSPYDPTQNINAGVGLLAQYYRTYGNWNDAIQAFSDGPGTVGKQAPSSQTLGLMDYITANYGVSFGDSSSGSSFDLASLGTDFGLPDLSSLSSFSISDSLGLTGVPDWAVWLALGLAGVGLVQALRG